MMDRWDIDEDGMEMFSGPMMLELSRLAEWFCGDDNCYSIGEMMKACMNRGIEIMHETMEKEKEEQREKDWL